MAEPLKNLYDKKFVNRLANALRKQFPDFNVNGFKKDLLDQQWESRELLDRMRHLSQVLRLYLPQDYVQALEVIRPVAKEFKGFEYCFFPDYVECFGLENFEESIRALEHLTEFSTSEFAVRAFIRRYPEKMLQQMSQWARSENEHVRRLASEGCRPRLPWSSHLQDFRKDPRPVLGILELLKDDPSEYVRRSVANNLNDISKDHPYLLKKITRDWIGSSVNTDRLLKHANRTLLKAGDVETLESFGFRSPEHVKLSGFKLQPKVKMGQEQVFSFTLDSGTGKLGKLRIEYLIEFVRQSGKQSKIFKLAEADFSDSSKQLEKKFSFRPLTTRKYYPGRHKLTIVINGREIKNRYFDLVL